jgi:hypothetical protein
MTSADPLPVLHAVRLLGFAGTHDVAARAGADPRATERRLLDQESCGLVRHVAFADSAGWTLTDEGKKENERQLADELRAADTRAADARAAHARTASAYGTVAAVHRDFRPLNARLLRAVTDWQMVAGPDGRLATNDHSDSLRDARILDELEHLGVALVPLIARLTSVLPRFAGYDERFDAALARARRGEHAWVDRTSLDSCHRVWFQLHEDLLATLGIERGQDEEPVEE